MELKSATQMGSGLYIIIRSNLIEVFFISQIFSVFSTLVS